MKLAIWWSKEKDENLSKKKGKKELKIRKKQWGKVVVTTLQLMEKNQSMGRQ